MEHSNTITHALLILLLVAPAMLQADAIGMTDGSTYVTADEVVEDVFEAAGEIAGEVVKEGSKVKAQFKADRNTFTSKEQKDAYDSKVAASLAAIMLEMQEPERTS